jgi:hypothetical protein
MCVYGSTFIPIRVHCSESNSPVIVSAKRRFDKFYKEEKSKLKIEFSEILFEADNTTREIFYHTIANF